MTIARYSSGTFHPAKILHAVLDSENLHSYLSTTDKSCLSRVNKFSYRFLCFHLHAQNNIFKIHQKLPPSTDFDRIRNIVNSKKSVYVMGASLDIIESQTIIIYKTETIFEAYMIVPKAHIGGTYKQVKYCVDINSGKTFVYLQGKENLPLTAKEIAIMQKFNNNERISTFHRKLIFPEGVVFISPYCNGGDLNNFIRKRSSLPTLLQREWSPLFALDLCRGLAFAVAQFHKFTMAHCDVKTENVLVNFEGVKVKVLLTDFGASGDFDEPVSGGGTLNYFSPEACRTFLWQLKPTRSSDLDIYALGLVCFTILTQRYPEFMFETEKPKDKKSPLSKKLELISSFYRTGILKNQIFRSASNCVGLEHDSPIGKLIENMIGHSPRPSIDQVINRLTVIYYRLRYPGSGCSDF